MRFRLFLFAAAALSFAQQKDWPAYGHDPAGTRYSPLTQIHAGNVGNLHRAWTYHMSGAADGNDGAVGGGRIWEVSPLVVNGVMYLTSAKKQVVALEPETGKEIWTYDVKGGSPAPRGLEYWGGDKVAPAEVFFGTSDGRLIALNAKTGKPVPGFGNEGTVNLRIGVTEKFPDAPYHMGSPGAVFRNLLITGA